MFIWLLMIMRGPRARGTIRLSVCRTPYTVYTIYTMHHTPYVIHNTPNTVDWPTSNLRYNTMYCHPSVQLPQCCLLLAPSAIPSIGLRSAPITALCLLQPVQHPH